MLAWGLDDYPVSVIFALVEASSICGTFRNADLPLILKSNGSISPSEVRCGADSRLRAHHAKRQFRGTVSGRTRRIDLQFPRTSEIPGPGSKRLHARRYLSV